VTPAPAAETQAANSTSTPEDPEKLFVMSGAYSLRNAAELRERLLNALDLNTPLMIDAGAAESVDLSTVQVLLAAQASAAGKGKELAILASAESPIVRLMADTGFLSAGGSALVPAVESWIISRSSKHD
jgi:anti-anti-sigma regulatory factor